MELCFKDAYLVKWIEKSNSIFQSLKKGNLFLKKNLHISLINIRRPPISGKMYLIPKTHKHFVNAPGR